MSVSSPKPSAPAENDPSVELAPEATISQEGAPITVLVARKIKAGHEKEFEVALVDLQNLLEAQPGFDELKAYKPGTPDDEHKVVLSFDNAANLAQWQECEPRKNWLARVKPLEERAPRAQLHTGLESWFASPEQEGLAPPPKYKRTLVTWLSIFPLITIVNYLLAPRLEWMPVWASSALTSALLVILMTSVVMPWMTRRLAKFLYPEIELPSRRK